MAAPTSLKLSRELKRRVAAAAAAAQKTAHAFMVEAIERETTLAERYDAFLDDALAAEREIERTGQYYAAEDVFRYMDSRIAGKRARRPRPRAWRK